MVFASFLRADDAGSAPAASGGNATAAPADDFWSRANLLGDQNGWRTNLNNEGWAPFANLTAEIWGNSRGGIRNGMTQDMWLNFGAEADMEKLTGWWNGGTIRATFSWVQGQRIDTNVGAFDAPTNLDAANSTRVYNLYVRQKLMGGQLLIKAGQVGIDDDFAQPASDAIFINASMTALPVLYGQTLANGDFSLPQYPMDAPGIVARYSPDRWPNLYSLDGIFLSDPGPDVSNNHGFDWRGSNSVAVLKELGWNYKFAGRAGTLAAGGFYNDGQFVNWSNGSRSRGIYGAYFFVNQVLVQNPGANGGDPSPVLTAYVMGGWAGPDKKVTATWSGMAGVNWNGPIPGRDNDVAGVAVLYTSFNPTVTRAFGGVLTASETVLEFTYQAQITPWFTLQPDAQVIFNPALSVTRRTAVVIGARATISF